MVQANSTKKKFTRPKKCNTAIIALLLLAITSVPFFAMKHVQFEEGFHPLRTHSDNLDRQQQSAVAKTTNTQQQDRIEQVSCQKYMNDKTIYDPNTELTRDETTRLTITDPKFYISLHSQFL